MPAIIKDVRYTVLKSLAERKQAFTEYIDDLRTSEREERLAREQAARDGFFAMLRENPQITVDTTYRWALIC